MRIRPDGRWYAYVVVVAVAPYACLKVLWLSGNMTGIPAGSPAREPGFVIANTVTLAMDVVACL